MREEGGDLKGHGSRSLRSGIILIAVLALGAVPLGCGSSSAPSQQGRSESKSSLGSARAAGRQACHDLTPLEAARHFRRAALRAGVTQHFAALVAEPTKQVESSTGYPQLVGALYATTVGESRRREAAAGCAEELVASVQGR
jgi:hypothetical protein